MCRLCDPHGPEDYFSDTPEDAARLERRRSRYEPDRPTRAEAERDEIELRRPRRSDEED